MGGYGTVEGFVTIQKSASWVSDVACTLKTSAKTPWEHDSRRPSPPTPRPLPLCVPNMDVEGINHAESQDKERKGKVIVDSSPRYLFDPVVPYRMRMVLPGSKFVVVLRDPTDRCGDGACTGIDS